MGTKPCKRPRLAVTGEGSETHCAGFEVLVNCLTSRPAVTEHQVAVLLLLHRCEYAMSVIRRGF